MICWIFGHGLPTNQEDLKLQMRIETFRCSRCRSIIRWKTMPKVVQSMRAEYLSRVGH